MLKESLLVVENERLKAENEKLQLKHSEELNRLRAEVQRLKKESEKVKAENKELKRKYQRTYDSLRNTRRERLMHKRFLAQLIVVEPSASFDLQ
ncbi:MAG: hypothetical protein ACXV2F_07240 [Halobacteriota archaeon]